MRAVRACCLVAAFAACGEERAPGATFAQPQRTLPDLEVATELTIDLVFTREAIWLYARDPHVEPSCDDVIFPDIGVCAAWSDSPCDEHLHGPSVAPCLRVAELVVTDTGERIPFDPHGGVSAIEPYTFDPYTAGLVLHLEGCAMSADIALPRPDATAPDVTAIETQEGETVIALDTAPAWVASESGPFAGTVCGTPPSDEVRLTPQASINRTFAAVAPLGTFASAFGALRVSQRFEAVRDVITVARERSGPVNLGVQDERYFEFGALESMTLDVDGTVSLHFIAGATTVEPLLTHVTLGGAEHILERDYGDGRRTRGVRPAQVRGGGIGRFEAFSVFWRERVTFEDVSGETPPVETLIWFEFDPGIAIIPF